MVSLRISYWRHHPPPSYGLQNLIPFVLYARRAFSTYRSFLYFKYISSHCTPSTPHNRSRPDRAFRPSHSARFFKPDSVHTKQLRWRHVHRTPSTIYYLRLIARAATLRLGRPRFSLISRLLQSYAPDTMFWRRHGSSGRVLFGLF